MAGRIDAGIFMAGAGLMLALAAPAAAGPKPQGDVLATVDGKPVTADEVRQAIGMPLYKLEMQAHELKQQKLRTLVADRLLAAEAKQRNVSVAQLLAAEMKRVADEIAAEDVDALLAAGSAASAEEKSTARAQLLAQKQAEARVALIRRLAEQHKVTEHLAAPAAPQVQDALAGGLVRGSEKATVTIVGFTDFHCPFCKMSEATLTELQAKYGDRVRYVHRDYPIAKLHPAAPRAHVAARCAAEQDGFWAYHDKLFAGPTDASRKQLLGYATEAGLNVETFAQCLDSGRPETALQQDLDAGFRLGVTGTPTYFINGRMLVGAQPLERFADMVEEELARQPAKAAQAGLPTAAQTAKASAAH